ncbi:MAG TPA: VCBS repeat-containing protein [Phycisphaerae bacterium]|nr:VCBS repeat-containing protein [Phycisphaerae bacterium]HNU46476.1 VCBS repeat-containing protein [Phycisphaerae bacterium]
MNHDRWLDVVVANDGPDQVAILRNLRAGPGGWNGLDVNLGAEDTFPVAASPKYVVAADLTGDGFPDAVTTHNTTYISVLVNDRDGGLTGPVQFTAGYKADQLETGLLNGDGLPDLAVPCWGSSALWVLLNGTAPQPAPTSTTAACPTSAST